MKIEIKNVEFSERMSEETNCFACDVYIDGKKVGIAKNDGHGGQTFIQGFSREDNLKIQECDKWCKENKEPHKFIVNGEEKEIKRGLDWVIDDLFMEWVEKKEEQKLKKLFETSIVIGVPNSGNYTYFKQKQPLKNFMKFSLENWVKEIKRRYCKDGVVILNDNLEELGIEI